MSELNPCSAICYSGDPEEIILLLYMDCENNKGTQTSYLHHPILCYLLAILAMCIGINQSNRIKTTTSRLHCRHFKHSIFTCTSRYHSGKMSRLWSISIVTKFFIRQTCRELIWWLRRKLYENPLVQEREHRKQFLVVVVIIANRWLQLFLYKH